MPSAGYAGGIFYESKLFNLISVSAGKFLPFSELIGQRIIVDLKECFYDL